MKSDRRMVNQKVGSPEIPYTGIRDSSYIDHNSSDKPYRREEQSRTAIFLLKQSYVALYSPVDDVTNNVRGRRTVVILFIIIIEDHTGEGLLTTT
ncbi:hypothetical protein N7535_007559 [Penicillium sp. DV-2018c]|nr:hypothetical protein N7461_003585 [Penicillium sp. DV-2018c]KAJ5565921.1 hypothetical protein N7535_007559 [Penicillium sp. DV-2018c]